MRVGRFLGLGCIGLTMTCGTAGRLESTALERFASGASRADGTSQGALHGPSCVQVASADERAEAGDRAVVVVVLDGARWQEVFTGVDPELALDAGLPLEGTPMPHLRALTGERGVSLGAPGHGAIMRASGPNFVSLPGYTELFTGHPPSYCADNDCARTRLATVADELRACASSPRDVAVFASWPEISLAASSRPDALVVSTGRHVRFQEGLLRQDPESARLLDSAADVDPWPGRGDFRPDRYTAALALHYLETQRPRFMFLGLGEPDEEAHAGNYAGYLTSLANADDTIDALVKTLDRMGDRGRHTTILITADHGRAADFRDHGGAYPESARIWLVALGADIPSRGAVAADEEHRLADIAPTIRKTMGLAADRSDGAGQAMPELLPTIR